MNKHNIKAFTIIEVAITMIIAAILMGITYTTYLIVSKSYLSFNIKNGGLVDLETLDRLLKKDFNQFEIVLKDSSGVSFENSSQTVKYKFYPDFIVRTAGITDTFRIKNEELITRFERQPVLEINSAEEQNRLDELDIILMLQNEKIPYHYYKHYSSVNLIKRNPDAIN